MNIGDAAQAVELPVKTLRYYEEIGLVVPARRANGYRDYADADLEKLRLIGRARLLDFGIEDCRKLLALHADQHRASADVKAVARSHLEAIDRKIVQLQALRASLAPLVAACRGDEGADCAILDDLVQLHLDDHASEAAQGGEVDPHSGCHSDTTH